MTSDALVFRAPRTVVFATTLLLVTTGCASFRMSDESPPTEPRIRDLARELDEDPDAMRRSIFREGLSPASRTDAVVWRAFARTMNLLESPEALMAPDVAARVLAVWQDRENRPPEPPLGPGRAEMLDTLGIAEAA